jgi:hypothetical protein
MALRKRGKSWYGDSQADIRQELVRFGGLNGYEPTQFADARCSCGGVAFRLCIDEDAGVAVRICPACASEHPIGDSNDHLADAELELCECTCGADALEITVGLALYEATDDVRWLYVGCRCPACNLTGCYGDWKNEFPNFRNLLRRI